MLTISTLEEAETFVTKQKNAGNDVRWDNYDIVFFRRSPGGVTSKHGAFRGGAWGFENRSPLTEKGTWEVDYRNVRRSRDTRS